MSEVKNEVKSSVLTKLDLLKAWFKWCLAVEVPVSFDRMQALAFGYSMNKILRKLYKDNPDGLQDAMRRHHSMFNTNCDWGSIIHGITISLEEQKANGEDVSPDVIQSLKLGLMGPLAGIGDSVDQGIVATIPLAIFVPMALYWQHLCLALSIWHGPMAGPGSCSRKVIRWVETQLSRSCTLAPSRKLSTLQVLSDCS